jgi:hypothetical protein
VPAGREWIRRRRERHCPRIGNLSSMRLLRQSTSGPSLTRAVHASGPLRPSPIAHAAYTHAQARQQPPGAP